MITDGHAPLIESARKSPNWTRMESDHHRRQELHQDMLVSLWRSLADGEPDGSVTAWAGAVTERVGAAHRAKCRRRRLVNDLLAGDQIELVGESADEEAALESRDWMARIGTIMQGVDAADCALLDLYLQGCDYKEIHEITGRSESTTRHRVDRLMRRVQVKLLNWGYQPPSRGT
jgi:RNA polymerase sigma factor (sigma-70 family)